MNYIYDIILNFNQEYYAFYEWKKSDNIINIRKIPCFKIKDQDYLDLKNNKIIISEDFINKIKNASSIYLDDDLHNNICLVTNGKEAMGLAFNNQGNLLQRSSTIFDEEQEIIEESHHQKLTNLKFIKNIKVIPKHIGRLEKEKRTNLTKYSNNLNETTDSITIKYLYYEYYEKEPNTNSIKKELLSTLKQEWNNKLDRLYQLVLLLNKVH